MFLKVCMRYTDTMPDAEQCLNDAFYKIFTKTGQYSNKGSFEGWMKQIVVNTCLDKLKAGKAARALKFVEIKDHTPEQAHAHITNDAMGNLTFKEIMRSLQSLPETYRMVFNLSVFEGYTHKEIAKLLSVKEGTSYWYLNQAREMLKKELSTYQLKAK